MEKSNFCRGTVSVQKPVNKFWLHLVRRMSLVFWRLDSLCGLPAAMKCQNWTPSKTRFEQYLMRFFGFFSFLFGTRLKKILSSLGFYAARMCYFVLSDELKSSGSDCKAFLCITLFFRHYSSFTWSDAQVNQYFRAPRPSHIASVSN